MNIIFSRFDLEQLESYYQLDQDFSDRPWTYSQWQNLDDELHYVSFIPHKAFALCCFNSLSSQMHLLKIVTGGKYQRQGMACQLLELMIAQAQRLSLETSYLEVDATNNPAISLYERLGFKTIATTKNFYANNATALKMLLIHS